MNILLFDYAIFSIKKTSFINHMRATYDKIS